MEVSPSSSSSPQRSVDRFGTRTFTSTQRSEQERSLSLREPASPSCSSFRSPGAGVGGRAGPGRETPGHFLTTQRNSFRHPADPASTAAVPAAASKATHVTTTSAPRGLALRR